MTQRSFDRVISLCVLCIYRFIPVSSCRNGRRSGRSTYSCGDYRTERGQVKAKFALAAKLCMLRYIIHVWSHYYTCVESLLYMCGVIIIHVWSHYYTCVESLLNMCGVIIIHVRSHYYTCVESLLYMCGVIIIHVWSRY